MIIHPGARAALRMLNADELDVADMMRDGDIVSPAKVGNMTMFKLRVSGIGYAYRPKLDEYVYRRPENYLTERFLRRCTGLPVVWEHPERAILNSDEFSKRIVGISFVSYIGDRQGNCIDPEGTGKADPKTSEVWTVAKLWNDDAIEAMARDQLSTSPSVVFRDPAVNLRQELEDGSTLLVEGPASLLDHLAVCENGVWDKSEEPTGVAKDIHMSELTDLGPEDPLSDELADQIIASVDRLGYSLDALAT
jgi:hypothetical protein